MIDLKELVNKRLETIQNNKSFKDFPLHFVYCDSMEEKAELLFVGINPSGETKKEAVIESYSNYEHNYFNKFKDLSKELKLGWAHHDLLYFMKTNQSFIDSELLSSKLENVRSNAGAAFIYEQLMVSKEVLELCRPKVIVVSNTKSRLFLGAEKTVDAKGKTVNEWMNYDFKFNKKLGTYQIDNSDSNLHNTPVFFTSMLTGQRALDNGSYERLKWHIEFVIEKTK